MHHIVVRIDHDKGYAGSDEDGLITDNVPEAIKWIVAVLADQCVDEDITITLDGSQLWPIL